MFVSKYLNVGPLFQTCKLFKKLKHCFLRENDTNDAFLDTLQNVAEHTFSGLPPAFKKNIYMFRKSRSAVMLNYMRLSWQFKV